MINQHLEKFLLENGGYIYYSQDGDDPCDDIHFVARIYWDTIETQWVMMVNTERRAIIMRPTMRRINAIAPLKMWSSWQ
jgi:hypothetical protein